MTTDKGLGDKLEGQIVKAAPAERKTARDLIASMEGEFARALPATLKVDRFMRVAMTELRQTPELGACTAESLLGALVTAAQLGLEPGGPLGEYYLTPRTIKGQGRVVVPIIGYRGLLKLARRAIGDRQIAARIVREGDHYREAFSTERGFFAEWEPLGDKGREPVGVLAAASLPSGDRQHVFLTMAEVEDRKARGSAGDRGPWATDFEAMARKTGLRALASELPQSVELAYARRVDEAVQTYRPGVDVLPLAELDDEPAEA